MFVHTTVLLTNLGVHIKTGRDDVLAWVTTLDDGKVVPQADISVLNCSGVVLARGQTGADGIWHHRGQLNAPDYCEDTGLGGLYVSARSEEHTSELQSLMRISYAVFCLNKKKQ